MWVDALLLRRGWAMRYVVEVESHHLTATQIRSILQRQGVGVPSIQAGSLQDVIDDAHSIRDQIEAEA